jgi:hypothetical protein
MAFDTRGIWEVDCRDATEECVVLLLLVADDKTSPPASVVVEGAGTIRSICNSGVDGALSTQDASSRDSNERSDAILYWIQLGNKFGVDHKHDWRSLPPLLKDVRVCSLLTIVMVVNYWRKQAYPSCHTHVELLKTVMYLSYSTFVVLRLPYLPLKKSLPHLFRK